MDDDVFNGLSYGDHDDWDVDDNTDDNGTVTTVARHAPMQSSTSSRIADLHDPLNWFHNIPVAAKKKKAEIDSEIVAITTKRIEEARMRRKAATTFFDGEKENGLKAEKLLKYPPLRGAEWMGISCPDNFERRYITFAEKTQKKPREKKSVQASELTRTINRLLMEYIPRNIMEEPMDDSSVLIASPSKKELWVDKYAPKSFFDLLTQDSNNRLALNWLNLWNEYVFNKPSVYDRLTEAERQLLEIEDAKPFLPKKKVMVIHGPTGCGKSSLALLAAKIKYEPFVINMNEIVNAAELTKKLQDNATNMTISFDQASQKPRCFILDGIDYAPNDVINALKKYVSTRKKNEPLRPMICTCINVFAPNLRDFRPLCFTLKVTVDHLRFFERVQKICFNENITIGNLDLKNFVDQCQSDIRLCLNNLQFRCTNSHSKAVSKEDIDSKNVDTSIFEAIDFILRLNKHLDKKGFIRTPKERFENITSMISRRPDLDKFANIIFNNMPEITKAAPKQIMKADRWFVEADLLSTCAYSHQEFSLLKYQSASLVAAHFVGAVTSSRFVKTNLSVLNINECRKNVLNMLNTLRLSKANIKNYRSVTCLIIDVFPSFMYIIQPPLPNSSFSMLQGDGNEKLDHVAALMSSYGLAFKAAAECNTIDYVYEPPLNEIVCYRLMSRQSLSLPHAAKAHILRQLEMHAIDDEVNSTEAVINEVSNEQFVRHEKAPWEFRYSPATAQAIKRGIKMRTYLPSLK